VKKGIQIRNKEKNKVAITTAGASKLQLKVGRCKLEVRLFKKEFYGKNLAADKLKNSIKNLEN
jgi:hypothetical protein